MMGRRRILGTLAAVLAFACGARGRDVSVDAAWQRRDGIDEVRLDLHIPPGHKIYADSVEVRGLPAGVAATPAEGNPAPVALYDSTLGSTSVVYAADTGLRYLLTGSGGLDTLAFEVAWLACTETVCLPPATRRFVLRPDGFATGGETAESVSPEDASAAAGPIAGFEVAGRIVGFQPTEPFVRFLESARTGDVATTNPLRDLLDRNPLLFALAILIGGLLLNLTPCVLPMIPINLGIIGAGAQASSRRRGFLLGGAYGLGITLAYGGLGLVSVVTGAAFGMLQSSPWFSAGIAAVFAVLALALFDVFAVDLSRFQKTGAPARAGTFGAAIVLGALSALLAGACVAPVLIWTLLLAADLHQAGNAVGVLLPFLLGLGMALPWPFAGAGLSFLPKPGAWMTRIKQGFGVLVLLFAFHYARLAWQGFRAVGTVEAPSPAPVGAAAESVPDADDAIPWRSSLDAALAEARASGKPVFVDLWATWCAACKKMDRTTLREPAVVAALSGYVPVKVQCERFDDPATKALMDALGAKGLPTYVVLRRAVAAD